MPEPKDILVVGSVNMDLVLEVEARPRPGETVLARRAELLPGGKGANQAVAACRLGASVRFAGLVGNDAIGGALRRGLEAEGIATDALSTVESVSGLAAISLTPDGENAITVAPGANGDLTPDRILALPEDVFRCRVLVLQLEIPVASAAAAARRGRAAGAQVILNPSPPDPGIGELLSLTDWLVLNRLEAQVLTGADDPAAAAALLLRRGPAAVFVTLGAQGVHVAAGTSGQTIPAPAVVPVDTTGAGDAFTGALAFALSRGEGPLAAAQLAVRAGAAATQAKGAQAAMPTQADLGRVAHTG